MDFSVVQQTNVQCYGKDIIVTRAGGVPTAGLLGIFRATHAAVDPNSGAPVMIDKPTIDVILADMPGGDIARGDRIMVPVQSSFPVQTEFEVNQVQKDGEGMATCALVWVT